MAARHMNTSASSSPLDGMDSIFSDAMVQTTSEVLIRNITEHYSLPTYTLTRLTQNPSGGNEANACRWIDSLLVPGSGFSRRCDKQLPHYSNLAPFHATGVLRPAVTVVWGGLPVFTVEVLSNTYEHTVKKALIDAIANFRILRAHNSSAESCSAFVFPGNKFQTCVSKVTVKFEKFCFWYTLVPLKRDEVQPAITALLRHNWSRFDDIPDFSSFVCLSPVECAVFAPGAVQVKSSTNLVVCTQDHTQYWKFSRKPSSLFCSVERTQAYAHQLGRQPYLQHSLLHSSIFKQEDFDIFQYEGLKPPLSRQEAKRHLLPLVQGVRVALEELHSNNIAHMDVRLPNICFTPTSPPLVKLIDLEWCELATACRQGKTTYAKSDMYIPVRPTWRNKQMDWKALGIIICFVLDDRVAASKYHCMISAGLVNTSVVSQPFVHTLLEAGEWHEAAWSDFQTLHSALNCPL